MTQEDKELLLKDLCARLPYGVKLFIINEVNIEKDVVLSLSNIPYIQMINMGYIKDCKPYLFPLSSMTEEERIAIGNEFAYGQPHKAMNILHQRHIDYRGLISMGLAIDATGKNIY